MLTYMYLHVFVLHTNYVLVKEQKNKGHRFFFTT